MHLQVATRPHKYTILVKSQVLASLKCRRTYNIFQNKFYQASATVNEIGNASIRVFELLYSTTFNLQQIRKQKYDTITASNSMDWFLYDNGLRHERVKDKTSRVFSHCYGLT